MKPQTQDKADEKITKRRLLLLESVLNCIPTIIGVLLWLSITVLGVSWIQSEFIGDKTYPLVVIIWLITISLPLTRIIPQPSLVYEIGDI